MRKVVVTGGTGYIGSHVARAFKHNNDQVFVVDQVLRPHTIKDIDVFQQGDFADNLNLIAEYEPDIIVHCAGTSLVGPSMLNPGEYYDNNIVKTIRLLNRIRDLKKKPLILFSSSASVYGEPKSNPIPESAEIAPISPYGNTKAMTERILQDYHRAYGINSICFRYFNAAGAINTQDLGQEPHATHIIARVLEAQIANHVFTLNGTNFPTPDGTCIRDYVHVQDIARAHLSGAEYLNNNSGAHVFNLGTDLGISNQAIINYVQNHIGPVAVVRGERRPGDPAELIANARKANQLLNWHPQYSDIKTIVDSAYQWYTK